MPNHRSDARRRRLSILDAAVELLNAPTDPSLEAIAAAAGVTRQTVYAHFPSREVLLAAALERVTAEAMTELDAVDLDAGRATDALLRLLDTSARVAAQHRLLFQRTTAVPVTPAQDQERHEPVAARLNRVISRGQRSGEFDDRLPAGWLATLTIRIGHAAAEEADAGRMSRTDAAAALRVSLLRLLGASSSDEQ
ncbi:TetR/AcrR family transcriptional regulator [Asanoa sp. NPDC049518]|uniref:TetR/AcrR family transcriptional regulator n=1 Tax=unclassified Asanoa TaxID=2685164 RepID=UPI003415C5A4